MSRCPTEYIRHMRDEIEYIENTKQLINRDIFLADETLKRSFVRSIEIIGEAQKNCPMISGRNITKYHGKNSRNARQTSTRLFWC